jgi:hypothetical protein
LLLIVVTRNSPSTSQPNASTWRVNAVMIQENRHSYNVEKVSTRRW